MYYVERHPYRSDFLSPAPWPHRLGRFAFHLAPSSSRLNWTTGTFSKWPMRIVGISPRRAAWYEASRDSPNFAPASGTVITNFVSSLSIFIAFVGTNMVP